MISCCVGANWLPLLISYREPLVKFLGRYPADAVDYFLSDKLANPAYCKLWGFIINHPLATELRNEVAKNPSKLMSATFNYNQVHLWRQCPVDKFLFSCIPISSLKGRPSVELQFQGILITRTLVKFIPNWLSRNRVVLDGLLAVWKSPSVPLLCTTRSAGKFS